MHTNILSATPWGTRALLVTVEIDISFGLVQFAIVGLPDATIKESSKRIMTALNNSGYRFPTKKITVNLAPADIKKEGSLFDLPITIGILQANQSLTIDQTFLQETLFLGELSLDGSIRFVKGVLAIAQSAKQQGFKRIIIPGSNCTEAALIDGIEIIGVNHLTELIGYLRNEISIQPTATRNNFNHIPSASNTYDFADVKGQIQAKRALQIAAAGHHNILFIGSPGSGKTMLAQRLASIMQPMTREEIIETSTIYSITGQLQTDGVVAQRPFRAPHHSISQAGLVGGGTYPKPGEISLAHHGILFLDELTEFKRDALEALRQPLESQTVNITRSNQSIEFPASFLLIAACNPCPCGYAGDQARSCICSEQQIAKYLQKLSGPFLDRIDLQIHIPSVTYEAIKQQHDQYSSDMLYKKVAQARMLQTKRFENQSVYNSMIKGNAIEEYCKLNVDAEKKLEQAFNKLKMSMRSYHKIIKVARTIADLENSELIEAIHIQEALMYRSLDKQTFHG